MTQHEEPDLLNTVLQLLTSQGSANLAESIRSVFASPDFAARTSAAQRVSELLS